MKELINFFFGMLQEGFIKFLNVNVNLIKIICTEPKMIQFKCIFLLNPVQEISYIGDYFQVTVITDFDGPIEFVITELNCTLIQIEINSCESLGARKNSMTSKF
jgi:hypothetical protein